MTRWTHADAVEDHEVDPTYNGNGLPAFWTCHVKGCEREVRLDGGKVPITEPPKKRKATPESKMSQQP